MPSPLASTLVAILVLAPHHADSTLSGIPDESRDMAFPGLESVVFEGSDFLMGNPVVRVSMLAPAGSNTCGFACYRELVRTAFLAVTQRLEAETGGEKPSPEAWWKVFDEKHAGLLASLDQAQSRLRLESNVSDANWGVAVRRASVRSAPGYQHGMFRRYGVDAGLAIAESQSDSSASLRVALSCNPKTADKFVASMAAFDSQASAMRVMHLSSERAEGRLATRFGTDAPSAAQLAVTRREAQRTRDWWDLNRRFQDALLALAEEAGAAELALEWIGETECRASPQVLGLMRSMSALLRSPDMKPTSTDLVIPGSLDGFVATYLASRNVRLRALADAAFECVTMHVMRNTRGEKMSKAVERMERAGEEWERGELAAANAARELFVPDARQRKAIEAYSISTKQLGWDSWRMDASSYRVMLEAATP